MISPIDVAPYLKSGQLELSDARSALERAISDLNDRIARRPTNLASPSCTAKAAARLQTYFAEELAKLPGGATDVPGLARLMSLLRHISQTITMLEVADEQRKGNLAALVSKHLDGLNALIQSVYEPMQAVAGPQLTFQPEEIVGIFFEDNFLARPRRPVPYLIIPDFLSQLPWLWNGVVHEVGHHIYRQFGFLRHELDVVVARALADATPSLPYAVQRLWFGWLEESFCDICGVLLLGEAYISSQFALYLYDRLPIKEALGSDPTAATPAEKVAMEKDLQRNLVRDPSGRHPVPAIRGLMAITVFEDLQGEPVAAASLAGHWRTKIVGTLVANGWKVEDPNDAATEQGPAELPFDEVVRGMRVVVNTILHKPLHSFECSKTLSELVAFDQDETLRETLLQLLKDQMLHPGDGLEEVQASSAMLPSITGAEAQIPDPRIMRCWIAAQHMNWRADTRDG